MLEIAKVFKWIFILLFLINFILLIITCVLNSHTSSSIFEDLKKHRSFIAVLTRDTNIEYLNQKMLLLIEDMIVIMKAYDLLVDWNYNDQAKMDSALSNYLVPASKITYEPFPDDSIYNEPWFVRTDKASLIKRFRGIWFTYEENTNIDNTRTEKPKLAYMGLLNDLLSSIFNKHLTWKSRIYVTLDFIYFTFQTGTFYKFPAFKQKKPAVTSCESHPNPSYYDPRCRPYYKQALESFDQITISQPYKFIFGGYGNDICIKSKEFNPKDIVDEAITMKQYLFCSAFTFFDYHLLKNQVEEILNKTEKSIYIIHYSPINNALKVIFNSLYYQNQVKCKEISSPDYSCEAIDLFVVYSKQLLDSMDDMQLSNAEYVRLFNEAKGKFNKEISKPLADIAALQGLLVNISLDNLNEEDFKRFSFSIEKTYLIQNKQVIDNLDTESTFYFLPLIGGYNYTDDYEIQQTETYSYYILIQEKGNSIKQSKHNFVVILSIEIFLYLAYLITWNGFIWSLFNLISHYFLKGFLSPLNKITSLYIKVGKRMLLSSTDKNYLSPMSFDKPKKAKTVKAKSVKAQSFIEMAMYWDEALTNHIIALFKSNQFEEVKESITTLKAFKLIINSKQKRPIDTVNLIAKRSDFSEMTSFFEAILFLFECFYINLLGKRCDYTILKLLIENIFSILLKEFNSQSEDNKKKMSVFINEFYHEKIIKVIQVAKSQIEKDDPSSSDEMDIAFDCLDNLAKLEENIIYRFSIHNAMLIQDRIMAGYDLLNFNPFDSDREEKLKLNRLIAENKKKKRRNMGIDANDQNKAEELNEKNNQSFDNDKKKEENDKAAFSLTFLFSQDIQDDINLIISSLNAYLELFNSNKGGGNNLLIQKTFTLEDINQSEDDELENEITSKPNENKASLFIADFADKLKELSALSILAEYYLIRQDKAKGLIKAKEALNKLYELEKCINKSKSLFQLKQFEWKKTNFILTTLHIFFIEKILFSFGLFYEIYHQTHNALFVYINILDLGPMYSVSIRRAILMKILTIVKNMQKSLLGQSDSLESFQQQINLPQYINQNLVRIKLSSMLGITSKPICKQVTFLFDLGNFFMKNKLIKDIIRTVYIKESKQCKDIFLHFCGFDSVLHIINDYNPQEKSEKVKMITKELNKSILGTLKSVSDDLEDDELKTFFSFLERYNEDKANMKSESMAEEAAAEDKTIRADNALYNTIIHCFQDWNDLSRSKKKNEKQIITLNNYLIMMVDIDSYFHEKTTNWKEISKLLFEKKISLIVILTYDEVMEKEEAFISKVEVYKNFLQRFVINGHLFVMRNLSMLKFIFSSVFMITFSEFNSELVYHYLKNVEQINKVGNKR